MKNDELIEEIEAQLSLMIAVATGGYERIKYENEEYKARRQRIREGLAERKLDDPNPHFDLWRWYGTWSSGDLSKLVQTYLLRPQAGPELIEQ